MAGAVFVADRRLYLDADKSKVLEEGDPAAAYLFCRPGRPISVEDQEAFGLSFKDGAIVLPGMPEPKAAVPPEDKAADKPEDK